MNDDMSDFALRSRLRQLPREIEPGRDLWPDIAAQLGSVRPSQRRSRRALAGLALAASLCLAIGLAWTLLPTGRPAEDAASADLVRSEAELMASDYRLALQQLEQAAIPGELRPALDTLDHSAASIQRALRADPGSRFLLDQLRRTYARRLSLTQRAVLG